MILSIGGTIGPISVQDVTQDARVASHEPILERFLLAFFIAKTEADGPMLQVAKKHSKSGSSETHDNPAI